MFKSRFTITVHYYEKSYQKQAFSCYSFASIFRGAFVECVHVPELFIRLEIFMKSSLTQFMRKE